MKNNIKLFSLVLVSALLVGCSPAKSSGGEKPSGEDKIKEISIQTLPTKLSYSVGDNFDPTGLVISTKTEKEVVSTVTYGEETKDDFTFSPSLTDALKLTDTTVEVTYESCKTTIAIQVSDPKSEEHWYDEYVKSGYTLVTSFPIELIKTTFELDEDVVSPTANEFVYIHEDAGTDEMGYPIYESFHFVINEDISAQYKETLVGSQYTVEEVENYYYDDDYEVVEYSVFNAYDKNHKYYISFTTIEEATQVFVYRFSDIFVDELTTNTDWTDDEKALMIQYLGQVMPFYVFGKDYEVGQVYDSDYEDDGYSYVYIYDTYYQDKTSDYIDILEGLGFKAEYDSYNEMYFYVYDNHVKYLEAYVFYDNGNAIQVYYSTTKYVAATSISLDVHELDVVAGSTLQLNATMLPKNAESTYEFSSSDIDIANVDEKGVVTISSTAPADSEVTITVETSEGITDTCVLTVKADEVSGVVLNSTDLSIAPGKEYQLEVVELLPHGVTPVEVTFTAITRKDEPLNEQISVSETGKVSVSDDATIGGTASFTVTVNSKFNIDVTVTVVPLTITDTLNQEAFGLTPGETAYANHTATGDSGITYKANCAAAHGVQIRSKNGNSGIVGGSESLTCKSITITFDINTDAGSERKIDIFGANEAFEINDMYGEDTNPIGSIVFDKNDLTKTYTFTSDYHYIGIRSHNGAVYMTSIEIVW